ncbi:MAG: glycosyltransferase family 2 protein [Patescibacteria group bacterium]|jgi:hypothetical protein
MKLSIIIANWNTKELTRKCLRSIFDNTKNLDFELIVIDNGSTDGSVEMIKSEFRQVRLIENEENTGYVFANNQGIATASGEFVLLLNSDTEIIDDCLDKMVGFMQDNQDVGIASCKILNPDKTTQLQVRRLPTVWDQAVILTKMHNFFPKLIKKYLWLDFDYEQQQDVEQVMGAFMLVRKKVIDQVGALDKNIWSWFEDVDYCKRVRDAGWRIVYTPIAEIVHLKSQSFAFHLALPKQKILVKSMRYYFRKNVGWGSYLFLLPLTYISLALAFLVQLFKIKKRNNQL